jgi:hypothetical protein
VSRVLTINSADTLGSPSLYNPPPVARGDNFSALGEHVASAWPLALGEGPTKRLSGLSVATMVAAGIAALVLEFAGQEGKMLSPEVQQVLRTSQGMCEVFRYMGKSRSEFSFITPWQLLSDPRERTIRTLGSLFITKKEEEKDIVPNDLPLPEIPFPERNNSLATNIDSRLSTEPVHYDTIPFASVKDVLQALISSSTGNVAFITRKAISIRTTSDPASYCTIRAENLQWECGNMAGDYLIAVGRDNSSKKRVSAVLRSDASRALTALGIQVLQSVNKRRPRSPTLIPSSRSVVRCRSCSSFFGRPLNCSR